MSMSREPGRYNLHRLGWSAFEDLCMQILRVVLGETCSRFRPGPDGGRDGWFKGAASGALGDGGGLSGEFIVQCKHTSHVHKPLSLAQLKDEVKKVTALGSQGAVHYLLMTNRQVTAGNEQEIREAFENIPGIETCRVLQETWVEDTIDAHPRLLRLVPRLYGIGDLSQILSFAIHQQTTALLEDLAFSLRTFVPTESYRRAERALYEHGFVVLVGAPASGKSSIAANLCMVSMAQAPDTRVLRIEHAEQFKSTWSPADAGTIYWVDDVFGETTLDAARVREWSAALEKVQAARRRKARIIFCTRDYILASAERLIKRSKADFINDARVRVDVAALLESERDAIMYNHIKEGDISRDRKRALKGHLSSLARLPSFSPELARRLGSKRLTAGLRADWDALRLFFECPVKHFGDVIHGLSSSETAALAACLLGNNSVPDPMPDGAAATTVCEAYGVTVQQVRDSMESLEGSLVRRVRQATSQVWQVHHPSMIEALQKELTAKSSKLVLYLEGAQLGALLRDTTTLVPPSNSHLVFLPDSVYGHLVSRLSSEPKMTDAIAEYLATRASDELLTKLNGMSSSTLDDAVGITPEPFSSDASPALAVRLSLVAGGSLLTDARLSILEATLRDSVEQCGWLGFLDVPQFCTQFPGLVSDLLARDVEAGFSSVGALYDWHAEDLSSHELVEGAVEDIQSHSRRLRQALEASEMSSPATLSTLRAVVGRALESLEERRVELLDAELERADAYYDEWKDHRYEERYELENGRFADVDE